MPTKWTRCFLTKLYGILAQINLSLGRSSWIRCQNGQAVWHSLILKNHDQNYTKKKEIWSKLHDKVMARCGFRKLTTKWDPLTLLFSSVTFEQKFYILTFWLFFFYFVLNSMTLSMPHRDTTKSWTWFKKV